MKHLVEALKTFFIGITPFSEFMAFSFYRTRVWISLFIIFCIMWWVI